MSEQYKYTVCIRCITYNHEKYLADALEGFVMQKTTFSFVAIVHDDASTDGTAAILREYAEKYPDIIKPIYETENQYSKHDGSLGRIMDAAIAATGAKYIAICEGDDYWTDSYKLQKQVDYMEAHEECVMCVNATEWECNGEKYKWGCQYDYECDLSTDEMIRNGGLYVNLCSTVYKKSAIPIGDARPIWWKMADVGDYPLHIAGTLFGKCHFFPEVMSVYRYQHEGSWTEKDGDTINLNHYQNETKWLELLNESTHKKYQEAIYTHLFPFMIRPLYLDKKYSTFKYVRAYFISKARKSKTKLVKDILFHCNVFGKK